MIKEILKGLIDLLQIGDHLKVILFNNKLNYVLGKIINIHEEYIDVLIDSVFNNTKFKYPIEFLRIYKEFISYNNHELFYVFQQNSIIKEAISRLKINDKFYVNETIIIKNINSIKRNKYLGYVEKIDIQWSNINIRLPNNELIFIPTCEINQLEIDSILIGEIYKIIDK